MCVDIRYQISGSGVHDSGGHSGWGFMGHISTRGDREIERMDGELEECQGQPDEEKVNEKYRIRRGGDRKRKKKKKNW